MTPDETPVASATKVRASKVASPRKRRQKLTPEQQDLASRYMPLARKIAKPIKLNWPIYREELDSAACLAIVEAARGSVRDLRPEAGSGGALRRPATDTRTSGGSTDAQYPARLSLHPRH